MPGEAEWEKAARGTDGRIYPWGSQWDNTRANTYDGGPQDTTPVGTYASKGDASPYGCHDLAGNAWQWCSSIYFDEPYQDDNKRENINDHTNIRGLRGGSWANDPTNSRAAFRLRNTPGYIYGGIGFRLARAGWRAGSH